jgi:hypothetical protein
MAHRYPVRRPGNRPQLGNPFESAGVYLAALVLFGSIGRTRLRGAIGETLVGVVVYPLSAGRAWLSALIALGRGAEGLL